MTTVSEQENTAGEVRALPRLQLALNVPNLEEAIRFYNDLFQASPAKVRPGYANYALIDPPLKLVLIEHPDATERLNHLGVEVASADDVVAQTRRLGQVMPVRVEDGTECCYALQDKVWVSGPDRTEWEFYTVLGDSMVAGSSGSKSEAQGVCCGPSTAEAPSKGCC